MYVIVYERTASGTTVNSTAYHDLKSLSFNPETDITLSSIPVCEFTVEIKTTDNIGVGLPISLYDDKGVLYARYRIQKAERIADNIVRVQAQSYLALMDSWVLKACRIDGDRSISQWMTRFMFTDNYVKSGKQKYINITYLDGIDEIKLDGFFPEQTMRERLQQICLAYGITVRQWFCDNLTLSRITEVGQIPNYPSTLIPAIDTFMRPERQYIEPAGSILIWYYDHWTQSAPEEEFRANWTEVKDDVTGGTWYCNELGGTVVPSEDDDDGKNIEISDVMIINSDNYSDVKERIWRFSISEEYTIDVVNNGQYYPNMPVAFYYDTDGDLSNAVVIPGIITKCDFTFGVQNRSKLTIARIPGSYYSDRPVYRVRVHYVYPYTVDGIDKTLALGRNDYYAPVQTLVSLDLPTIYVDAVGDTLAFVPDTDDPDYITGIRVNDHDEELTINYKRREAS